MSQFFSLKNFTFNSAWGEQYPRSFIISRGALKLDETQDNIHIGVIEDSPKELYYFLKGFHIPKNVRFSVVAKTEFASFIGTTTEYELENTPDTEKNSFVLETIEQDAPIINIINALCIDAIKLGASDIHIEAQNDSVHIRYRIDGVLRLVKKIEITLFQKISNRIKIMAGLNTLEQRLPQDGRTTVTIENSPLDLRVSIVPVTDGESIVLRIFNKQSDAFELGQLGFSRENLTLLQTVVKMPYGLIIITGPTGSGKTTTLHALLKTLPFTELKVITLEDPVEQLIPGINQIQINDAINLGFDSMLKRVLRQDPDIIMVGEIRDNATAEITVRAALTGHLILSTVHANNSVAAITRLADMGIAPYMTAATLRCIAAQRLVRKLCPHCSQAVKPDKQTASVFRKYNVAIRDYKQAKGCDACGGTGYSGRTVIGEAFQIDYKVETMIERGKSIDEIAAYYTHNGMTLMAVDGLEKCACGLTSLDELRKEALV
jgi:general secretion pathway protein E/type IV pilus assembly protein PilB